MTIQTSESYQTDVNARRLFGRMHNDVLTLAQCLDAVVTATNAMRLALGAATLTLAEVEALHLAQSHEKRSSDATLFEAQTQLSDRLEATKNGTLALSGVIGKQVPQVQSLMTQANRINERDIVDDEPGAPNEGLDYVELAYFMGSMSCSKQHVRDLIAKGALPKPDAVEVDDSGGRPKLLWLKHKADAAMLAHKKSTLQPRSPQPKKGVAALV